MKYSGCRGGILLVWAIALTLISLITGSHIQAVVSQPTAALNSPGSGKSRTDQPAEFIRGALWNKNDTQILTWADNGAARVWDAQTGELLLTMRHGTYYDSNSQSERDAPVTGATWNAEETRILTWSFDGTARIWDAATGQELLRLSHLRAYLGVRGAVWSPDEAHLLTWATDSIRIWDTSSGEYFLLSPGQESTWWSAQGAAWNHGGTRILTWGDTAQIWNVSTGQILLTVHHDVYSDMDGTVGFADIMSAAWNADETRLLTRSTDKTVRVWDTTTGEELYVFHLETVPDHAAWNGNATRLLILTPDSPASLWDITNGRQLLILPKSYGAQWNADGTRALVWGSSDINIVDAVRGEIQQTMHYANVYNDHFSHYPGSINGAAWNKDKTQVLVWRAEGMVQVWDAASGERLLTLFCACDQASWSHDETRILTWGSKDWPYSQVGRNLAAVWDAQTGKLLLTLYHGSGPNPYANLEPVDTSPEPTQEETLPPDVQAAIERARTFRGGNLDWNPFVWGFAGVPMILVPAGCFEMGVTGIYRVCFEEPFWFDVNEVDNAQFQSFGGQASLPQVSQSGIFRDSLAPDFPRVSISWYEARDYCQDRNARLPTEAEWEYVARGPDGWEYPSGNAGELYGQNPWVGANGMVAVGENVGEWVSDWFHFDYFQPVPDGTANPTGPVFGIMKVIRGTPFFNGDIRPRSATFRDFAAPGEGNVYTGFRCVRPVSATGLQP